MPTRFLPVLIFFLFLMDAGSLGAQGVNRTDTVGRKQGPWSKTDSAGRLIYTGQFRDNMPVDSFRYYYPGGKLKTLSVFANGGREASSVSWYPNGRVMARGRYVDEKKEGPWRFYSEFDTALLSEESYSAGIKNGISTVYFPTGGVSETTVWKNGIREGPWQVFFSDGSLKMKGGFLENQKSGHFDFYYNSGKMMISGDYLEGHQHGKWLFYDEKGEVVRTETYDRGILLDKTPKEDPVPSR